jgi:nucleotide-binding universal stress UspA family protein
MELKQILAATDFSDQAGRAVERAALLAREHGATLHLVHVVPVISWKMFGRTLVEHPLITEKHLVDAARHRLDQLTVDVHQRHAIDVRCSIEIGRPHQRIAEYARNQGIDLTVLGPHAESLMRDLFVGTTARNFLHKGRQPALIAQVVSDAPYERVLLAVDFSDVSKIALEAALRIAPEAAIHALHVYDVLFEGKMRYAGVAQNVIQQYRDAAEQEAWRLMREFLDGSEDRIAPVVQYGHPARVVLDEAQKLQADLIVMGKRGRSDLDELFLGSTTENIMLELDRDLLLVSD